MDFIASVFYKDSAVVSPHIAQVIWSQFACLITQICSNFCKVFIDKDFVIWVSDVMVFEIFFYLKTSSLARYVANFTIITLPGGPKSLVSFPSSSSSSSSSSPSSEASASWEAPGPGVDGASPRLLTFAIDDVALEGCVLGMRPATAVALFVFQCGGCGRCRPLTDRHSEFPNRVWELHRRLVGFLVIQTCAGYSAENTVHTHLVFL